ncbi:DSBA oxidoreductase [Streptomyces sp. NRRL F-5755]|uniref:thioredoxin domain-containing protein n=1 Tax=Streptomyces sp. NRRL F-5755 TaxID=1519475 RepID=UPI0006B003E0|nr:thioredoxin domain-containing protein [Streptomyces sp. NRRL F-5755]KOT86205.1 DSBA oxidoreductase [Streptomyces sp. NRRL F-5755]
MSHLNSHTSKQAVPKRLCAERERQKERMCQQFVVGGAMLAVLAVVGGITMGVADSSRGADEWAEAKSAKLVRPANTSGKNGTEVVIGKKGTEHTLSLFEDARCPGCSAFEQKVGETIEKDLKAGKYKVSFHLGTSMDGNLRGTGSKNALSAMGAALNVSPDAFLKFKKALFSKEYHPEESGPDKFADNDYLLKVADTVFALKHNAEFRKAVWSGTYNRWALEMSKSYASFKDVESTPTVKLDDTVLGTDGANGKVAPATPDAFDAEVDKAIRP